MFTKENFTRADGTDALECICGCGKTVKPEFREMLNEARELAGVPFTIDTGMVCLEKTSCKDADSHAKGLAADIEYTDAVHLTRIVHALSRVGFLKIETNEELKLIHVDTGK